MTGHTKNRIIHSLGLLACVVGIAATADGGVTVKSVVVVLLLAAAAVGNVVGFVRANTWFR